MQRLLHRTLLSPLWGEAKPSGAMLMHGQWLLHSTLDFRDHAVHDLAHVALAPAAGGPCCTDRHDNIMGQIHVADALPSVRSYTTFRRGIAAGSLARDRRVRCAGTPSLARRLASAATGR